MSIADRYCPIDPLENRVELAPRYSSTLTDEDGHAYYVQETMLPSTVAGNRGYIAQVRDAGSILLRGPRRSTLEQAQADAVGFYLARFE